MPNYPKYVLDMIKAGEKQYNMPFNYLSLYIASKCLPYIRTQHLKKGEVLLDLGGTPSKFAYINSGLLRRKYLNSSGDACTFMFMPEGTFFTDGIMMDRSPSIYMIDALEDTQVTFTPMDIAERLIYENEKILRAYFKVCEAEIGIFSKEWRRFMLSAADRYKFFLERYPMLDGRISQQEIASYLGITPASFSRVKKANADFTNGINK